MKKITLSMAVLLAVSTFAMAETMPGYGPDSYKEKVEGIPNPNPNPNATANTTESKSNLEGSYLGFAYSYTEFELELSVGNYNETGSDNGGNFTILGGYNFNEYIGIEGRYAFPMAYDTYYYGNPLTGGYSGHDVDVSYFGLYLKPMVPIGGNFNLYGLLGYGNTSVGDSSSWESDFQWGIGAGYTINNTNFFIDYTRIYDEDETIENININTMIYTVSFGISYKFQTLK